MGVPNLSKVTPKGDNQPQRRMTNPNWGRLTLKGGDWSQGDDQPLGRRVKQPPIPMTRPPRVGSRGTHSHILTWKLLAHHDIRPYHANPSLIYARWSWVFRNPSLYKEIPPYQGIQVSSLPLYKPMLWISFQTPFRFVRWNGIFGIGQFRHTVLGHFRFQK